MRNCAAEVSGGRLKPNLMSQNEISLDQRILSVQYTKSRKPRYIPLSDFAVG